MQTWDLLRLAKSDLEFFNKVQGLRRSDGEILYIKKIELRQVLVQVLRENSNFVSTAQKV